jgi:hypothetical protein
MFKDVPTTFTAMAETSFKRSFKFSWSKGKGKGYVHHIRAMKE